jgi:predicted DCC family thiol-disulfide oxidoreductase YuxK
MTLPDVTPATVARAGWILYDGACGFCSWWVRSWQKVVEAQGFAVKDLQSADADGSVKIPAENLLDDIRILTPSGELVSGADAYLYVARRIWWAWPFYAVFSLPGFNWALWRGYRWVNRNRYRISPHCALPQHSGLNNKDSDS